MKRLPGIIFIVFVLFSCRNSETTAETNNPYILVLGIAQDAGYPQAGCNKECCRNPGSRNEKRKNVTSLGLVIPQEKKLFLFEATPDFTAQWQMLREMTNLPGKSNPDGIFLTHAHIGHYSGIMYTGKEAMGSNDVPVYVMPRMKNFLEQNGPWSQLVNLGNITLRQLKEDSAVQISPGIHVIPFIVPHRDEYSETVGYRIISAKKIILFIPDIDKWQKWQKDITKEVKQSDLAFADATFFKDGEIERDMNEVPHPFVTETIDLFDTLPATEKNKIIFIHFNHTNPLLRNTPEKKETEAKGYRVAYEGMKIYL